MMLKQKIGFAGIGNMGSAILEGVLQKRVATHSMIMGYDKLPGRAKEVSKLFKVRMARSAEDLCENSDIVFLAMKPQDFPGFAEECRDSLKKGKSVISILAGLTIKSIRKKLGPVPVVRAMPNLGAKMGESKTVIKGHDKKLILAAEAIFRGCGEVVRLPENTFDQVTAISGSGPAYFFYLMELLTDFGIKNGFPKAAASRLAVQTAFGSALLARNSKDSCAVLRQKVTSKKGTTEAAIKTLMRKQFGKIFHAGLDAAARRSRQLRKG